MRPIETRLNEVRKTTANPREMQWQYLATDVLKTWKEEFCDPDTGEVIIVPRSEILFKRGTYLDGDRITEIQFFQQTGDIGEVEVSNQKREAKLVYMGGLVPWSVSVQCLKAKHRFLLYANSAQMAIDVTRDFVELHYSGAFVIQNVKTFTDCIIIPDEDTDQPEPEETDDDEPQPEKKFYQIDVTVKTDDGQYTQSFVIHEIDVETSMQRIEAWLKEQMRTRAEKRNEQLMTFETAIERAIAISCTATVEKEFSLAYVNAEK